MKRSETTRTVGLHGPLLIAQHLSACDILRVITNRVCLKCSLPEHLRAPDLTLNSSRHSLKTFLFTQMTHEAHQRLLVIVGYRPISLLFTFYITFTFKTVKRKRQLGADRLTYQAPVHQMLLHPTITTSLTETGRRRSITTCTNMSYFSLYISNAYRNITQTRGVECRYSAIGRLSPLTLLQEEEEEEADFAQTLRSVAWELIPPFGPWSRRGLNPMKPVYDPDRPDGRLKLTASAFTKYKYKFGLVERGLQIVQGR